MKNMDLEHKAIERIKTASEMSLHHYGQPLVCTYSGGKDSDVLLELFKRSGVLFEVANSHTTVDAPPTVYHIRKKLKKLEEQGIKATIHMPEYKGRPCTMWSLIEQKGVPTRLFRFCCGILKENLGKDRFVATGVRWDESRSRENREAYIAVGKNVKSAVMASDEVMLLDDNLEKRKIVERCQMKGKMVVNPIIDWKNTDIWEYIRAEHIDYNELYDNGYTRVGCIGCPMASKGRWKEFSDFPTYQRAYIRAFDKMLESAKKAGKTPKWKTGQEVFLWWMEDQNIAGQMDMFDDGFIN